MRGPLNKFWQKHFHKECVNCVDRIIVDKSSNNDWTTICIQHTGSGEPMGQITLRGEHDLRDLVYALKELLRNT